MSAAEVAVDTLQTLLRECDKWYVWVVQYGITHSQIQLALHTGLFPRQIKLECQGCVIFSGELQGGPHALELQAAEGYGSAMTELHSIDRAFRVICQQIKIVGKIN